MKKITSYLVTAACVFSMFSPAVSADEESVKAISVNKPIYSTYYGEEGYNGKIAKNANDGDINTYFQSNKGVDEEDALIIDLGAKYKISYITVTFIGSVSEYYIGASDADDLSGYDRFERSDGVYKLPSEKENNKYRYVGINVPKGVASFRIREMTVYSGDAPATDDDIAEVPFKEQTIPISVGKTIKSRLYGDEGFNGNVAANANDGDEKTAFVSTPTEANPVDWLRIELGDYYNISGVSVEMSRDIEQLEVSVTNEVGTAHSSELSSRILLEKDEGGIYRLPEEYRHEKFHMVEVKKASSERAFFVEEITVLLSTRDMTENCALGKRVKTDGQWGLDGWLTDGDREKEQTASSALIDLLVPSYINNIDLYGTDKDNVKLFASLFETDPENMEPIGKKTEENKKYRYICIMPDEGEEMALSEVEVNSFDTDISAEFKKSGDTISGRIKNISYDRNEKRRIYASAFDEYGGVVSVNSLEADIAPGEESNISVQLQGGEYAARSVLFAVKENGSLLGAAYEFSGDEAVMPKRNDEVYITAPEKDLETAVKCELYNDGAQISISPEGGVLPSDRAYLLISDPENEIIYADTKFVDDGCSFAFYLPFDASEGEYSLKLVINDALGNRYSKVYSFSKTLPDQDLLSEAIKAFKDTDADGFKANYEKYYKELGVISFGDIPYASDKLDRIGVSFVRAISDIKKWKKGASDNITAEDIHDALLAAAAADALENKAENAPYVISRYGKAMDNILDGTENNEALVSIFSGFKDTSKDLFEKIRLAAALSHIKDAKTEDIVSAMKKYSDILDIDLDMIDESGADIYDVAKRLGNNVSPSWEDGLSSEVKKIVSELTKSQGGGTSGPGGGSSGSPKSTKTTQNSSVFAYASPVASEPEEDQKPFGFSDLPSGHWAAESIKRLYEAGIVDGVGDNRFEPDRAVKRSEFTKLLVSAYSLKADPIKKPAFSDCVVSDWFYPYVDAAVSCRIIHGVSDELFCPDNYIKRQDAALMCENLLNYIGFYDFKKAKSFSDNDEISEYAKDAVGDLSGLGIINGFEDDSFRPAASLTRAQAAVITDALIRITDGEAIK